MSKDNWYGRAAEKPFHYTTHDNNVTFDCPRQDLDGKVTVTLPAELEKYSPATKFAAIAQAAAEMGAFHASEIRPHLNGFRGYDCVEYEVLFRLGEGPLY